MHWISRLEQLRKEQRPRLYEERPFLRLPLPVFLPEVGDDKEFSVEYDEETSRGVIIFEIPSVEETSI